MKMNYNLNQRLTACILLVNLFLQSCGGSLNQVIPQEKEKTNRILKLSDYPLIEVNKKLVTAGGYLASFYEEDGELRADLKADEKQPKPNYKGVPVVVELGTNLTELTKLDPIIQKRRVEINRSNSGQLRYVTIRAGGIAGGMMEGDSDQKSENGDNQDLPKGLLDLPEEVLEIIMYFGDQEYLKSWRRVCKTSCNIIANSPRLTQYLRFKNYQHLLEFAMQGDAEAQFRLGQRAYKAWEKEHTEEQLHAAKEWLHRAEEQEHPGAVALLKEIKPESFLPYCSVFPYTFDSMEADDCQQSDMKRKRNEAEEEKEKKWSTKKKAKSEKRDKKSLGQDQENKGNKIAQQKDKGKDKEKGADKGRVNEASLLKCFEFCEGDVLSLQAEERGIKSIDASLSKEIPTRKRPYLHTCFPVILAEEIEIDYNKTLGSGSQGIVYQATYKGLTVAAKELRYGSKKQIANFENEAIIMFNHRHPNVIAFLGFCPEEKILVMEYASGGSLRGLLRKKNREISWQYRHQIALDVAEGMSYLHSLGVLHRDLKSNNILLDGEGRAKIADFGLARLKSERSTFGEWSGQGTDGWMAPELFLTKKNSKAADVYSYGMVLWELGARKRPFANFNGDQSTELTQAGGRETISDDTPVAIRKIIELCWLPEPPLKNEADTRQRPEMDRIRYLLQKSHPGFKEKEALISQLDREQEEDPRQVALLKMEQGVKKENDLAQEVNMLIEKQSELEAKISRFPKGVEILGKLKNTQEGGSLRLEQEAYAVLSTEQLHILFQHPCFKKITLDLSHNNISAEGVSKLSAALPNTQLHTLDLKNNNISAEGASNLAAALPNTQLHTLDLRNNNISDEGASNLAAALPNTQLHTLDLSHNKITAEGVSKLSAALPNTQLHTLDLGNNDISDEGASNLAAALPNTQLHTLYLSWINISEEGASNLAAALPKTQLHTLDLSANSIFEEGASNLAAALPKTQLHTLDLAFNDISDEGATKLAAALPNTQLHTLNLGENDITAAGATKLSAALPNTQIHTLYLGWNWISDEGANKLAEVLPKTQIHTLDLSYNNISAEGATNLAAALPNTQIHTLYLGENDITAAGATNLAAALPNTQIHTLYLGWNDISDEGANKLAEVLPKTQIHTLDLSLNNISDEGASNLSAALPRRQIHTLNLNNNKITAVGATNLAAALPNTQLHTLALMWNHITDEGATNLAEALPNTQIHTLHLWGNNISAEMRMKLKAEFPKINF